MTLDDPLMPVESYFASTPFVLSIYKIKRLVDPRCLFKCILIYAEKLTVSRLDFMLVMVISNFSSSICSGSLDLSFM